MILHNYKTAGGKDLIENYIDGLSKDEMVDAYSVLAAFREDRLDDVSTKHWRGSVWEVYFYRHNRMFYVIVEDKNCYFLHACRKQKNKTEQTDANIVLKRAKELGKELGKTFM